MTIKQFCDEYVRKHQMYETEEAEINKRIKQREKQIIRLQNKFARLSYASWVDLIIEPIAKELVKFMPDRTFEILGPFGLTSETSIHFYKKGVDEKFRFIGNNCKSINFRPLNLSKGEIGFVDVTKNTHEFKNGTMGEVNGMNYATIPLLKTASIQDLLKLVK